MDSIIEIRKAKNRKDFLSVSIRNHILLEMISSQIYLGYKGITLETSMIPTLTLSVFEHVFSKKHLTNEERCLVTKSTILKLIPLLKKKNELNQENLKLADIEVMSEEVDEELVLLISNLIDCYSQLRKRGIIQPKGFLRKLFRFLKTVLI